MAYPYNTHPFYSSSTPSFYSTNTTHTPPFPSYPYYNPSSFSTTTPITSPTPNLDFNHGYSPPSHNPYTSFPLTYSPPSYPTLPTPTLLPSLPPPNPYTHYSTLPTPNLSPPSPPPTHTHTHLTHESPQHSHPNDLQNPIRKVLETTERLITQMRATNEYYKSLHHSLNESFQEKLESSKLAFRESFQKMRKSREDLCQKFHVVLQTKLPQKHEEEQEEQKDEDEAHPDSELQEDIEEEEPEEQIDKNEEPEDLLDEDTKPDSDVPVYAEEEEPNLDGEEEQPNLVLKSFSEIQENEICSPSSSWNIVIRDEEFFSEPPLTPPPPKPPYKNFEMTTTTTLPSSANSIFVKVFHESEQWFLLMDLLGKEENVSCVFPLDHSPPLDLQSLASKQSASSIQITICRKQFQPFTACHVLSFERPTCPEIQQRSLCPFEARPLTANQQPHSFFRGTSLHSSHLSFPSTLSHAAVLQTHHLPTINYSSINYPSCKLWISASVPLTSSHLPHLLLPPSTKPYTPRQLSPTPSYLHPPYAATASPFASRNFFLSPTTTHSNLTGLDCSHHHHVPAQFNCLIFYSSWQLFESFPTSEQVATASPFASRDFFSLSNSYCITFCITIFSLSKAYALLNIPLRFKETAVFPSHIYHSHELVVPTVHSIPLLAYPSSVLTFGLPKGKGFKYGYEGKQIMGNTQLTSSMQLWDPGGQNKKNYRTSF